MVLTAKVFKVNEIVDLKSIAQKLSKYRVEEEIKEGEKLLTEIVDLDLIGEILSGVYIKDTVIYVNRRGEKTPTIITLEAPFRFSKYKERLFLTIIGKKNWANYVANELSKIIFIAIGVITEAKINSEALRRYHEENPEATKIIFFDNVDIPNINKLSLYGEDLKNTLLYTQYLSHGTIWYIVAKSKKHGYMIGLTRKCVVTAFSKINQYELLKFIEEEIYPLIE
ncbi:MAG: hypothetical protein N3E39_04060 [Candidatus Methanomethylicia archaeon]|nr:hypothetical protein [Candidatus Methanomethylicia archaeon]